MATTLEELRAALIELDEPLTLSLTEHLISQGRVAPMSILNTCQQALKVVGERYERQEYFISGLIMAGELFKEVLDLVQPHRGPAAQGTAGSAQAGTILLGTVAGDIHDIGKNLFATTLRGFEFNVVDLGVDVAPEHFLHEAERKHPDVICLSGLIMLAFESMKATVELLRDAEERLGYRPPVVLGGSIIDGRVCQYAGADSWSTDAMEGVRICQSLVEKTGGARRKADGQSPSR